MEELFLGIDLGTSSIKFAIQNQNNKLIFEDAIHYNYEINHNNWTEINPNRWFDLVIEKLKHIFSQKWGKEIVAISTTGQMHTVSFLDKDGESVRNAILWNDKRSLATIPRLKQELENIEPSKVNSRIVSTGSPLANLLWVRENEPSNYNKIKKILMTKDYINYKLTGMYATDYCDASTSSMYDFISEDWSEGIIDHFGFSKEIFPDIRPSSHLLGVLLPQIKEELDINHDVRVYVGTGDNAATFFASNSLKSNDLLISIGTSGVVLVPASNGELSKTGKSIAFKLHSGKQHIIVQGSLSTGGQSLSWWIEEILNSSDFADEQAPINKDDLLCSEEIFIPYLSGEKYIYQNSKIKGSFINLSTLSTRERMTLAVLEGVTFALKNLTEKISTDYNQIKVIGGGMKSRLWKRIFANTFQKKIFDYSTNSNAVVGAIKIAQNGYQNVETLSKQVIVEETELDSDLIPIYEEKYSSYLLAVKHMNQFYS